MRGRWWGKSAENRAHEGARRVGPQMPSWGGRRAARLQEACELHARPDAPLHLLLLLQLVLKGGGQHVGEELEGHLGTGRRGAARGLQRRCFVCRRRGQRAGRQRAGRLRRCSGGQGCGVGLLSPQSSGKDRDGQNRWMCQLAYRAACPAGTSTPGMSSSTDRPCTAHAAPIHFGLNPAHPQRALRRRPPPPGSPPAATAP